MQSKKWVALLLVAMLSFFGFKNASAKDVSSKTVLVVENNSAELQNNAIILDSEKITILFVAENSLLLTGADVKKITPGKILISSESGGFLRK